jgi:hypothetical protein
MIFPQIVFLEVEEFSRENYISLEIFCVVDNDPHNPTHLGYFHAYIKAMFLFPNTI